MTGCCASEGEECARVLVVRILAHRLLKLASGFGVSAPVKCGDSLLCSRFSRTQAEHKNQQRERLQPIAPVPQGSSNVVKTAEVQDMPQSLPPAIGLEPGFRVNARHRPA